MPLRFRFTIARRPSCCGSPMRGDSLRGWVCIVKDH